MTFQVYLTFLNNTISYLLSFYHFYIESIQLIVRLVGLFFGHPLSAFADKWRIKSTAFIKAYDSIEREKPTQLRFIRQLGNWPGINFRAAAVQERQHE